MKENTITSRHDTLARHVLITFAHLNSTAFGIALGLVCGLWVFLATVVLVVKGGEIVGPTLALLAQYYPGYTVTWPGAIVGFLYAFVTGFVFGYVFASMRNTFLWVYIHWIRRRAQQTTLSDLP